MKPRRVKATKAEQERYDRLKQLPCIACYLIGRDGCGKHEIQHMTSGGRRLGNEFTYALGAYHHQGYILPGWTGRQMLDKFGPSFGKSKRAFQERFGSEKYLLEQTNKLLGVE